jgi:hypothetical protein
MKFHLVAETRWANLSKRKGTNRERAMQQGLEIKKGKQSYS